MSLFLFYFEIGKPVPPSVVPLGLWHTPVAISFRGRAGPPREGLALTTSSQSSERLLAFGDGSHSHEGEIARSALFQFLERRLDAGARPHLVFLWMRGSIDTATVDLAEVVRVPLCALDVKLRALRKVKFMDSSEIIEVTAEPDEDMPQSATSVLVDISTENTASEPDPMRWQGNLDLLVGESLFRIGASRGALAVVHCLNTLAHMVTLLRDGARVVTVTFEKDSSPLRCIRQTTEGARAITLTYRGVSSVPVLVTAFDQACRDAVLQFARSLSTAQRAALKSGGAAKSFDNIALVWPELRHGHASDT